MLRKMIPAEQRANELKLLAEYIKAGKVNYINTPPPEEVEMTAEEEEALEERMLNGKRQEGREHLGNGNFRFGFRPKEKE